MSKQATLTLIHWKQWTSGDKPTSYFTVEKVTDSVSYLPGQNLSMEEVQDLCQNTAWKVTIQKPKG